MTYASDEIGITTGSPIELYRIISAEDTYYYTSAQSQIEYEENPYIPVLIERSEVRLSQEYLKEALTLSMSRSTPFAYQFLYGAVEGVITVEILRSHDLEEYIAYWSGEIRGATLKGDIWEFEVIHKNLGRNGTQRILQRLCALPLFSSGHGMCGVTQSSFEVSGILTDVSGLTLTAAEFGTKADGWFVGGKITVGSAIRHIISHTGTSIIISSRIRKVVTGMAFTATAGCDHTIEVCDSKFSNSENFGGCTHLNSKNPFQGDGLL